MAPEQHSSWAKLLALALLLAALANGAGAYFKRIGVLDREAYKAYWAVRCTIPDRAGQRPCLDYTTPAEIAARAAQPPMDAADAAYRYVYRPGPVERLLKLAKDAFWAVLLATGAWTAFAAMRGGLPGRRRAGLLLWFGLDALAALVVSLPVNGVLVALAGLRGMLFLPLALAGRWLARHAGVFALGASALLVVQAALVPFELWRGLHIFHEWSPWDLARRAAGTLVQPNSLGVFTACALAFHFCFAPRRAGFAWLAALGGVLVVASASGTGMVCAALAGAALLWRRAPAQQRRRAAVVGAALAAAVLLAVPLLSGRDEMFESPGGRVELLADAVFGPPAMQALFGRGLGVGTNTALSLATVGTQAAAAGPGNPAVTPTDSTLVGLVLQVGVLGAALFYAALAWAARRDRRARPFYAVAALCSLTLNLTELFPVNVLLGLALAHSIWLDDAPGAAA